MQTAPIATAHDDPAVVTAPAPPMIAPAAPPSDAAPPPVVVTPGPHPVISFPVLGKFYPRKALRAKMEGDVLATCAVTMAGGLTECVIDQEDPAGYGFGTATLKALEHTEVQVVLRGGVQIPRMLRIPIKWRLPPPAATPPVADEPHAAPSTER